MAEADPEEKVVECEDEEEGDEDEGVLDQILGHISDEDIEEADETPSAGPESMGSDTGAVRRALRRGSSSRNMDKSQEEPKQRDGGDLEKK
eukprot:763872-Rhodomonas_salina.1